MIYSRHKEWQMIRGKNETGEWGLNGGSKSQNGSRWYQGTKAGDRQGTLSLVKFRFILSEAWF